MPLQPINRPPKGWWNKIRPQIGKNPKYQNRSEEDKDAIAAGIYQNYDEATKRRLRGQYAGKDKSFMSLKNFAYLLGYGAARGIFKDFGGWTSQNADWERGFREGERKAEDRQRGVQTQRSRMSQFNKKQSQQLTYATEEDNPVRLEQRKERQDALRYRAGKGKEQHQGAGKVPAAPGTPTKPQLAPFKPEVPEGGKKFFHSQRSVLYFPIAVQVATKSVAGVQRGDLVVEGIVSMPIKDLQGDVLELPALVKAKNEMVRAPYNHVWLDHESPYAKPQNNQATPPIGNFIASKIIKLQGLPALWARMVVNKAHPKFDDVAYELKRGYYNAFSMEFVPIVEGLKMIRGRMANAISDIKYFATCLVRAPASEQATVQKVYVKAFANSSQFYPVRVAYPGGIGQSVRTKGIEENLRKTKLKNPEPEEEPEMEPELEEEPEEEQEPMMDGGDGSDEQVPTESRRLKVRDYDRETGSTAAERMSTAMGEWGDPALEKRRAKRATIKDYIMDHERQLNTLTAGMKAVIRNTAMIGKALQLDLKGIDSGEALDTIDWDQGEGGGAEGSSSMDEQEPPEVKPGKMKPAKQRVISSFDVGDEDIEDVEASEVGGEGTKSKYILVSPIQLQRMARAVVRKEVGKTVVVRHGGFGREEAGLVSEQMKLKQLLDQDDGSLESQMEIWGM